MTDKTIHVGDIALVRLGQDTSHVYRGVVTSIWMPKSSHTPQAGAVYVPAQYLWESAPCKELVVGMRLEFHSDDERAIYLLDDVIEDVLTPDEWGQDDSYRSLVQGQLRSLYRVMYAAYRTHPRLEAHQPVFGWPEPEPEPVRRSVETIFNF